MQLAKRENIAIFIVGHVTKEGVVAGPRVLEHMVDTVLYFEGDRHASYRLLRAVKNRFGSTNEIGVFEMCSEGLTGTTNDQKDGWFVGYTRYYTTSVWVGYDMPKKLQGLMGNTYPGKIWQSFMSKAHEGLEPLEFLPYARISDDLLQQQESGSGQPEDNPAEETPEEETPEEETPVGEIPVGEIPDEETSVEETSVDAEN